MGKHEDQLRWRGTIMPLKSVKKDQVRGMQSLRQSKRSRGWGGGALRGSGVQPEETVVGNWVHGEGPSGKARQKIHSGVFNQINSKKNF